MVRSRPATILRPAPAALQRPVPTAPPEHPIGGGHLHEASSGLHSCSPITPHGWPPCRIGKQQRLPPVFSSPAAPGWNGNRFGFDPGLRTRGYPRRTPRRRQAIAHWPEYYTFDISRTSKRCLLLHSCTLTSHVVAGRFHHHARDPLTGQVLTQRQDLRRHRRPRRDCLDRLASTCPSHADADLGVLLRDVQPSPLLLPPSDPTFQSARRGEDRDFQHPADTHSPQPPARPNLRAPRCAPKAAPICSTEDTRAWQRRYPYHDRIQPLSIEQWGCRTPATTTG